MDLSGKKILVIGAAKSGVAAARFAGKHGGIVFLNDIKGRHELDQEMLNSLEEQGIKIVLGTHADLKSFMPDLIIPSPGVPLGVPTITEALEMGIPVWSEFELAFRYTKAVLVVITGTNGKTTTTSLTGQIFNDARRKVFIGGNIGIPFIKEAENLAEDDIAVLEASSFQLEPTEAFKPKVAVILNITPDHIDRHGSMEGYIKAKTRIFANQDNNDWLIINYDDETTRALANEAPSRVIYFSRKHILNEGICIKDGFLTVIMNGKSEQIIRPEEIAIPGGHNLENALAAAGAGWVLGVDKESIAHSLRTFPGVEHRLEHVLEINGVSYINDSKGTNPDASIKALEAFDAPIILIAGGKGKGSDFLPFAEKIMDKVKALVLVGNAAGEIEDAVKKVGYDSYYIAKDFKEAVYKAGSLAEAGDIVLLSPACASFDMFQNFEHRGQVFKELVYELAKVGG